MQLTWGSPQERFWLALNPRIVFNAAFLTAPMPVSGSLLTLSDSVENLHLSRPSSRQDML